MDRTLVKIYTSKDCIGFRTISRKGKSSRFLTTRSEFNELDYMTDYVASDCCGFAEFYRDPDKDTLRIRFTWLKGSGENLTGREETVVLRYSDIATFLSDHYDDEAEYKALSIDCTYRPKLVFHSSKENLHAAVNNKVIRRKLSRALRDNFKWPDSDEILFFNDFCPYSFFFIDLRKGEQVMCGGLILHGQENMRKAYYSLHT